MDKSSITEIRILPNNKKTFPTEEEFRYFVEHTMMKRGGYYYFPNVMMHANPGSLVLFQYDGMIRACAVLKGAFRKPVINEFGEHHAGYYLFDKNTITYLSSPIDKEKLQKAYPKFKGFSQAKQSIPLEYLDDVLELL